MASAREMFTKDGKRFFRISVSRGRGLSPYTTRWYVPAGWSKRTVERALAKVSADFERRCRDGEVQTRLEKQESEAAARREAAKILTLQQFVDQIFMPEKMMECSTGTCSTYDGRLRKHILPALGDMKITEITSPEIRAFLLERQRSGLGQSALTGLYSSLVQIFRMAVESGMIENSPMANVRRPHIGKEAEQDKPPLAYTAGELAHILVCADREPLVWRAYIHLLADSGLRRGEALGLHWSSVNFETGVIEIRNNLCYTPQCGVYEDSPKTPESRRTIDVSANVLDLLKQLRADQRERIKKLKVVDLTATKSYGSDGFVFTGNDGITPIYPESVSRYFKRFGGRYGIESFHPHRLRHTAATLAILNGADPVSVAKRLGHSNPAITLGTYSHATAESVKAAGDIVRRAVAEAGGNS